MKWINSDDPSYKGMPARRFDNLVQKDCTSFSFRGTDFKVGWKYHYNWWEKRYQFMGAVALQKYGDTSPCRTCEECKKMLGPNGEEGPGGQI